jgi:hypothetical protein
MEVAGDFGEKDGTLAYVSSQTAKPALEAGFAINDSGNSPALGS